MGLHPFCPIKLIASFSIWDFIVFKNDRGDLIFSSTSVCFLLRSASSCKMESIKEGLSRTDFV